MFFSLCVFWKKKQFYKGSKHAWNVKRQYCDYHYTQQNMSPSEMGFSPDIKMESIEEEREALGNCCIIWKKGRKKLVEIWQDNGTSSSFISNQ